MQRRDRRWVRGIDDRLRRIECSLDMTEDRFVEVDSAESLDALGGAEGVEAIIGLAQNRGVKSAIRSSLDAIVSLAKT